MFMDETHSSLAPIITRTWAIRGQTPMIKIPSSHKGMSLIGGLLEDGRIVLQDTQDSLNALGFIGFLEHVLKQVDGKVVVLADNAPIHKAQIVKDRKSVV